MPSGPELSLHAELLLLSIDPAHGGLLPPRSARLREALAAAARTDGTGGGGWRAGRRARRELLDAGLVTSELLLRNLRLTDIGPPGRRFRSLWAAIESGELSDVRDRDLAMLLASAGALAPRLTSHERWIAWRRLKEVMAVDDSGAWVSPLAGAAPLSDGVLALGVVALHGMESLAGGWGDGGGAAPATMAVAARPGLATRRLSRGGAGAATPPTTGGGGWRRS